MMPLTRDDRSVALAVLAGLVAMVVMLLVLAFGLSAQNAHGTSSEETPRGTMDGVNTSFTINFQPLPFSSLHVYLNGLRLHRGYDYVLGGPYSETVIFALPATAPTIIIPQPGDVLLVDYTY
jgi:hypothetical protein